MFTFENSTALVTGGHRGIGKALVQELLDRGAAKVYATSRVEQPDFDPRVVSMVVDVTNPASVAAAAQQASDVSLVVNNAGVANGAAVLTGPVDGIRADLETNLFGLLDVSRSFAPVLARQESSALLNILSALSWFSVGGGYDISKSAAWSATNALRLALAPQRTTVTGFHVGLVDTDMGRGYDLPKISAQEAARAALDGVAAGDLEVLADDTARQVKAGLSGPLVEMYPQLVAATA